MRLITVLITVFAAAFGLGSCSNLDENSTWEGAGGHVQFTAHIQKQNTVRATNDTWANGDEVGIYMKAAGTALGAASLTNRHFVTTTRGELTPANAGQAISYPKEGKVDFVAYYPYTTAVSGTKVAVDVSDQSSPTDIDLLYSNNATNKSSSSGTVSLGFAHQLSSLVLNITADATVPSTTGLAVSLKGVPTSATFDLADGSLAVSTATGNVPLQVNTAGTTAEGILIPGNVATAKLSFTLNGKAQELAIPVATLEKGCRHIIPITLTMGEEGEVYVQFGAATITDWTTTPGNDIDVDFGDVATGTSITIADLRTKYAAATEDAPLTIDEDLSLTAVVGGNDISGNIFKQLYIQDETGGISFLIDHTAIYNDYAVGQKIVIDLKGFCVSVYGKELQLGHPDGYLYRTAYTIFNAAVQKEGEVDESNIVIKEYNNFDEINVEQAKFTVVRLKNVHFEKGGLETFAPEKQNSNKTLLDANGQSIVVRNSGYSDFYSETLPAGTGTLMGILSVYNGNTQLYLRSYSDVQDF